MENYIYVDKDGKARKASKKHKYWYKYEFVFIIGIKTIKRTYGGEAWMVKEAKEKYFEIWKELRERPEIDHIVLLSAKINKIY